MRNKTVFFSFFNPVFFEKMKGVCNLGTNEKMSSVQERALEWYCSSDKGASSMYMWRHMIRGELGKFDATKYSHYIDIRVLVKFRITEYPYHPVDIHDFGRCYRLLELIPEWKSKITIMKDVSPKWLHLVTYWDALTNMYRAGQYQDVYTLMNADVTAV